MKTRSPHSHLERMAIALWISIAALCFSCDDGETLRTDDPNPATDMKDDFPFDRDVEPGAGGLPEVEDPMGNRHFGGFVLGLGNAPGNAVFGQTSQPVYAAFEGFAIEGTGIDPNTGLPCAPEPAACPDRGQYDATTGIFTATLRVTNNTGQERVCVAVQYMAEYMNEFSGCTGAPFVSVAGDSNAPAEFMPYDQVRQCTDCAVGDLCPCQSDNDCANGTCAPTVNRTVNDNLYVIGYMAPGATSDPITIQIQAGDGAYCPHRFVVVDETAGNEADHDCLVTCGDRIIASNNGEVCEPYGEGFCDGTPPAQVGTGNCSRDWQCRFAGTCDNDWVCDIECTEDVSGCEDPDTAVCHDGVCSDNGEPCSDDVSACDDPATSSCEMVCSDNHYAICAPGDVSACDDPATAECVGRCLTPTVCINNHQCSPLDPNDPGLFQLIPYVPSERRGTCVIDTENDWGPCVLPDDNADMGCETNELCACSNTGDRWPGCSHTSLYIPDAHIPGVCLPRLTDVIPTNP